MELLVNILDLMKDNNTLQISTYTEEADKLNRVCKFNELVKLDTLIKH